MTRPSSVWSCAWSAATGATALRCSCRAPDWISASDSESRLDVASSRIRIGAFVRKACAIATRWRSPPESFTPRSPIRVP